MLIQPTLPLEGGEGGGEGGDYGTQEIGRDHFEKGKGWKASLRYVL